MKKLVLIMGMIFLIFPLVSHSAEWEKELIDADQEDTMDKLREVNKEVGHLTSEIRDTLALAKKMRAKRKLSKKERLLFSQFPKRVRHQREKIKHHIQVRMMVMTKFRGDLRFDFKSRKIRRLMKKMRKQIEALKNVAKVLSIYEKHLRKESKKGAA